MSNENFAIVVPWHNPKQRDDFLAAWGISSPPSWLLLTEDDGSKSCALTKNRGIDNALAKGADYIVVLDDDCYPVTPGASLDTFAAAHIEALQPQDVRMVIPTTIPVSPRGMPYRHQTIKYPVAASMGFWTTNPDFDSITSLVLSPETEVQYMRAAVYGRYFPFSGMNYAFHRAWADCARHVNVPRFDDIWMGWVWEKVAYCRGACFNLNGPLVEHVRQSDVWKNFHEEAQYLEVNETLWEAIHLSPLTNATELYAQFFPLYKG